MMPVCLCVCPQRRPLRPRHQGMGNACLAGMPTVATATLFTMNPWGSPGQSPGTTASWPRETWCPSTAELSPSSSEPSTTARLTTSGSDSPGTLTVSPALWLLYRNRWSGPVARGRCSDGLPICSVVRVRLGHQHFLWQAFRTVTPWSQFSKGHRFRHDMVNCST